MALAIAVTANTPGGPVIERGQRLIWVFGQITASGNYVALGDTLDWTKMTAGPGYDVPVNRSPIQCYIQSQTKPGVSASGFLYSYCGAPDGSTSPSATLMQVFGTGSGNQAAHSEISAGAYPAGVTGDTIVFSAAFIGMI